MLVSFIVIAYNEERNIKRTLDAILAQRDMPAFELLVVNDGSKDRTAEIAKEVAVSRDEVRIVDLQPNQGRGAARAAGIRYARGSHIVFVDADIVLPADWLLKCMPYMRNYDACGGTAVPDGDVSFVHRVCVLQPKAASHATTVTGSNGLFKAEVFRKINFDPKKRNGEDVDLGFQIARHNIRTTTVPGLLVEHLETKDFFESINWLFESGVGASRQFYEHPKLRVPDMAFGLFVISLLVGASLIIAGLASWPIVALGVSAYVTLTSFAHLRGKFVLGQKPFMDVVALLINNIHITSYYLGRLIGLFTQWRRVRP